MNNIDMHPGDRIREARLAAGITQRALAQALGIDKSAVAQWENPKFRTNVRLEHLRKVAEVLGVPPSQLLDEPALPGDEGELIRLYRALPEATRKLHLALARTLVTQVSEPTERPRHPFDGGLAAA